ncbi:MAG: tRNA dihydrouridine synthase DusB [bacterium]
MPDFVLRTPVILAPMSGYNTPAFLRVAAEHGCGAAYTGLLTSHGIVRGGAPEAFKDASLPSGFILVAQLFGSDPDIMAEAASILEDTKRFAAIDVNMGCPVRKVVRTESGAALMRDPPRAAAVVEAVVESVDLPVTVKLRSGWNEREINAPLMARLCEEAGASAAALHPRAKEQGFRGKADWTLIRRVKERAGVPVIGSGDVGSPPDAKKMLDETGCDAVMIGRAALRDPSIIGRTEHFLRTGELLPEPSHPERIRTALRHFRLHVETAGEKRGVPEMRKHFAACTRGLPGSASLRGALLAAADAKSVEKILECCLDALPHDREADEEGAAR